jgi:hypothetical protein
LDPSTHEPVRWPCNRDRNRLAVLNQTPDSYRKFFPFPIPPGFKRFKVDVRQSPDGKEVDYELVDRQEAIHVMASGVARMEALFSYEQTKPDASRITLEAVSGIAGSGGGVAGGMAGLAGGTLSAASAAAGGVGFVIGGLTTAALAIVATSIQAKPTLIVRIWGTPDSKRGDLANVAT